MNIIVLGGGGFIGKNLVRTLAGTENHIFSFDLSMPDEGDQVPGVTYIVGDFFDDYVLQNAIIGKDLIYHCVCTLNPGNSNSKYIMGYERDLLQTIRLCDMVKGKNVRMIFLSSGGTVYGNPDKLPVDEDTFPRPINHYGNLKLAIENTLRVFNIQNGTDFKVVRISNPYGPGQDYNKGVGFIDAALKRAIANEPIEIWGNGDVIRDYIYIQDVCDILVFLGEAKYDEMILNISSGRGISQNEIISEIKKYEPSVKIVYKEPRSVDVKKIVLSNKKLHDIYKHDLTSFQEGVKKYYRYLKEFKVL
jgi:UDP-glucose 4-epimerase